MKKEQADIARDAEDALRACLADAPFVAVRSVKADVPQQTGQADLVFEVELPEGPITIIVEIKRSGQPRLARDAVNQLVRWTGESPRTYGVFAAPYISSRGADVCKAAGVGYVDLSGNCRLCFGRVYIEQTGNPNEFARERELQSLYAPKASRVLRVLLAEPKRCWKVQDLSNEAEVSIGHVSNVKQLLQNREWLSSGKEGTVLTDPQELLCEWAENYSYCDNEAKDYYCMQEVPDIEQQLAVACSKAGQRYALTMFSGAVRLGVTARYKRVFAYVEGEQREIAGRIGLKPVSSGANVSLLTPYDGGVFYGARDCDGVRVPSPIQVFLDLKSFRGRGEETAEVLLREVIQSQW